MILSQQIAAMLEEMLREGGGEISLVRNELAGRIGCVPSQINYVIASRFTPERGYLVESRRGGGGFIRIRRVVVDETAFLRQLCLACRGSVELSEAQGYLGELVRQGLLSVREAKWILAAMSDSALSPVNREGRGILRGSMLQTLLLEILAEKEEEK